MKDLEVVSRPMPSWRVQQTFVPMEAAGSLAALGISARGSDAAESASTSSRSVATLPRASSG